MANGATKDEGVTKVLKTTHVVIPTSGKGDNQTTQQDRKTTRRGYETYTQPLLRTTVTPAEEITGSGVSTAGTATTRTAALDGSCILLYHHI